MKNVNILENPMSFTRQGRIRRFSISYRPLKKIHGFFFRKFIYFHHFGKFPARFARKTSLCCIFLLAKLNFTMCACQSTDNWPIFERSYFEKKKTTLSLRLFYFVSAYKIRRHYATDAPPISFWKKCDFYSNLKRLPREWIISSMGTRE